MLPKWVSTVVLVAILTWFVWGPVVRSFLARVLQFRRKQQIRPEVDYEAVAPEQLPEAARAELARLAPAMVACGFRAGAYARSQWAGGRESFSALWMNAATGEMACQKLIPAEEDVSPTTVFDIDFGKDGSFTASGIYLPHFWLKPGERTLWCADVELGPALYRVFQAWVAGERPDGASPVVPAAGEEVACIRATTNDWLARGVARGDLYLDPVSMALRYTWKGAFRIAWMTRPARLRQILQRDKDIIESLGLDRWPPPPWHAFPVTFEQAVPAAEPAAVLPARALDPPEPERHRGDYRPPETNSA